MIPAFSENVLKQMPGGTKTCHPVSEKDSIFRTTVVRDQAKQLSRWFPFLELPPELRVAVYEAYFRACFLTIKIKYKQRQTTPDIPAHTYVVEPDNTQGLLLACRSIRIEARPVFAKHLTLSLPDEMSLHVLHHGINDFYLSRIRNLVIREGDSGGSRFTGPLAGRQLAVVAAKLPALQVLEINHTRQVEHLSRWLAYSLNPTWERVPIEWVRQRYPALSIDGIFASRPFQTNIRVLLGPIKCVMIGRETPVPFVEFLVDADKWRILGKLESRDIDWGVAKAEGQLHTRSGQFTATE